MKMTAATRNVTTETSIATGIANKQEIAWKLRLSHPLSLGFPPYSE